MISTARANSVGPPYDIGICTTVCTGSRSSFEADSPALLRFLSGSGSSGCSSRSAKRPRSPRRLRGVGSRPLALEGPAPRWRLSGAAMSVHPCRRGSANSPSRFCAVGPHAGEQCALVTSVRDAWVLAVGRGRSSRCSRSSPLLLRQRCSSSPGRTSRQMPPTHRQWRRAVRANVGGSPAAMSRREALARHRGGTAEYDRDQPRSARLVARFIGRCAGDRALAVDCRVRK